VYRLMVPGTRVKNGIDPEPRTENQVTIIKQTQNNI